MSWIMVTNCVLSEPLLRNVDHYNVILTAINQTAWYFMTLTFVVAMA